MVSDPTGVRLAAESVRQRMKPCMRLLIAGTLIAALIGCSSGATKQPAPEPGQAAAASSEPVELVFFSTSGWTQEAFNERFGNAMRTKFPNYRISYIQAGKDATIESLITAGTKFDIFWDTFSNTFINLERYKLQVDMSELIKKYKVDLNQLDSASINIAKTMSGGKMYAIPLVNNTDVLYYNKDIFDKFGVPYPKDGMMRDEVLELAKRLNRTDGGATYYGLGLYPSNTLAMSPLSIPYIDAKTDQPTVQTDPRWKTLFEPLVAAYRTTDNKRMADPNQFLKTGNIAMFQGLANMFLNFDASGINWDLVTYPLYKEAPGIGPQPLPTMFGITSMSKHPDDAMQVLAYMLTEEVQKSLSERAIIPVLQTPAVKNAFGTKAPYKDKNYAAILKYKFADIPPMTVYDKLAQNIYLKPLEELASGKTDLNTAFRNIEQETKQMIAQEKVK